MIGNISPVDVEPKGDVRCRMVVEAGQEGRGQEELKGRVLRKKRRNPRNQKTVVGRRNTDGRNHCNNT